jgi:predicted DNA-binding helix-hairpin-helix protein
MLDLDIDPKLAWALRHPQAFPVDLNTAPKEMRCCAYRVWACATSSAC